MANVEGIKIKQFLNVQINRIVIENSNLQSDFEGSKYEVGDGMKLTVQPILRFEHDGKFPIPVQMARTIQTSVKRIAIIISKGELPKIKDIINKMSLNGAHNKSARNYIFKSFEYNDIIKKRNVVDQYKIDDKFVIEYINIFNFSFNVKDLDAKNLHCYVCSYNDMTLVPDTPYFHNVFSVSEGVFKLDGDVPATLKVFRRSPSSPIWIGEKTYNSELDQWMTLSGDVLVASRIGNTMIHDKRMFDDFDDINITLPHAPSDDLFRSFVSPVCISKELDNVPRIIFAVDFMKLFRLSLKCGSLIISDSAIKESHINYVKLYRRRAVKDMHVCKYVSYDSDCKYGSSFEFVGDGPGVEIDINTTGLLDDVKYYSFRDEEMKDVNYGIWQYFVDIKITDPTDEYLRNTIDNLEKNLRGMDTYLNLIISFGANLYKFTKEMQRDDKIKKAYKEFRRSINLFILTMRSTSSEFARRSRETSSWNNNLLFMTNPDTGSFRCICEFIEIYKKLIARLYSLVEYGDQGVLPSVGDYKNKSLKYSMWFENDVYDATDNDSGIDYGTPDITGVNYIERANNETLKFYKNEDFNFFNNNESFEHTKYSYLTPMRLYLGGEKVQDLHEDFELMKNNIISKLEFVEKMQQVDSIHVRFGARKRDLPYEKNYTQKFHDSLKYVIDLGVSIVIRDEEESDCPIVPDVPIFMTQRYASMDNSLVRALMGKNLTIRHDKSLKDIAYYLDPGNEELFRALPNHFKALVSLSASEISISNRLNNNLMIQDRDIMSDPVYSSLHRSIWGKTVRVQMLKRFTAVAESSFGLPVPNLSVPDWRDVDPDIISEFKPGSKVLCRLVPYLNPRFGIVAGENTELPVYNKYFIMSIPERGVI